jgi:hypothetical protein
VFANPPKGDTVPVPLRRPNILVVGVFVLGTSVTARAEDGNCYSGFAPLAGNPEIALGRINSSALRTYFIRNSSELKGCPSAEVECRGKSYLVPGNRVVLSRTNGAFVCVDFADTRGVPRLGWVLASAVDHEPAAPVTLADWFGVWTEVEAKITLKPSSKAGMLSISGDAIWGSLDPERVKAGAVHIGSIEGIAAPEGAALSFAMGANGATLPVDKGEEGDCKVWMRRLGPYLPVSDNNNCGGMNVSFSGLYKKSGAPPKGSAAPSASAAGAALAASQPQEPAPLVASAGGAEETFLIHGQIFKLVPCSYQEGTAPVSWKDVKEDLPRAELAKGNMTVADAKAALKKTTEALNVKVNTEITALYPAHRPISATNEEWSSIGEAEEKLGDVFYGNRAIKELGPWAASMQKEFRVASALNCLNNVLNPIVSTLPAPRP